MSTPAGHGLISFVRSLARGRSRRGMYIYICIRQSILIRFHSFERETDRLNLPRHAVEKEEVGPSNAALSLRKRMRRQSGSASYHYTAAIPRVPRVGGHKGGIPCTCEISIYLPL